MSGAKRRVRGVIADLSTSRVRPADHKLFGVTHWTLDTVVSGQCAVEIDSATLLTPCDWASDQLTVPQHKRGRHPEPHTQRTQRNKRSWRDGRNDRFYNPCVLAVAFVALDGSRKPRFKRGFHPNATHATHATNLRNLRNYASSSQKEPNCFLSSWTQDLRFKFKKNQ